MKKPNPTITPTILEIVRILHGPTAAEILAARA